jgi:hypothetical protein
VGLTGTGTSPTQPTGDGTGTERNPGLGLGSDRSSAKASRVPMLVVGAGGTLVVIGGILHATWFKSVRDDMVDEKDRNAYNALSDKFDISRGVVIGTYGVGLATVITGMVLKYTMFKGKESSVTLGARLRDGGGMVTLGWRQ